MNQRTREDMSLRNTNLHLKNNNRPYFDNPQTKNEDKPNFQKSFKPRELIRTSWYVLQKGAPPDFKFNALLQEIPKEGDVFNDDNNNIFTVKNVTRNLITVHQGALKETTVNVLFSQKSTLKS